MERIDFDRDLNPEQKAAALAPDGPVLVIAAAGTGKTRTLTYRVAHLVERGVPPERILLLTFTNRAAGEMLDRARTLVGERVGGIWGGTFHHLANRLLRRHGDRLGYGHDYTILDQDDAKSLVRACIAELGLKDKHFPKPEVAQGVISLARNRDVSVPAAAQDHFHGALDVGGDLERVAQAYDARKRSLNAMDFDDLLTNVLRMLEEQPALLERYSGQFLHMLVDEYQDTNPIQARLVDRLAGRHRNLLVVGDDFQSIYGWRGADFRHFLSFPDRYTDVRIFRLETNYRSLPGILSVANACIAGNPEQFQKTLRPVRESPAKPVCAELRDGDQQARFVTGQIALLRRQGLRLRDIAVLYRSHYHALELQMELTRNELPYVITSGVRFFEQAHVKDVLAPLRLMQNPGDELAFVRLLCMLPRVGERTAVRVFNEALRHYAPGSAPDAARVRERLPAGARGDWDRVSASLQVGEQPPERLAGEVVGAFSKAFYEKYAAETYENYDRRLEDLDELVRYTVRFPSLADFLNEVALMTNVDTGGERPEDEPEDSVLLSTIHQAKGLEWKAVFVLWLADGLFPSARSMDGDAPGEGGDGEAEERRLFYVASTRARDVLYLCYPKLRRARDGSMNYYSPSRFLTEIPPSLLARERVDSYF